MASVGLLPGLALLAGAVSGLFWQDLFSADAWLLKPALPVLAIAGWAAWWYGRGKLTVVILAGTFFSAGLVVAADAQERALRTPLRAALDRQFGGFEIGTTGPPPRLDPIAVRALLLEDAARGTDVTTLRAAVTSIRLHDQFQEAAGGVTLSVGGVMSHERAGEWRAGRTIETSATFRRPARYLNEGVPDLERDLALDGTTLFGSVKSALLLDIDVHGSSVQETAARIRRHVRQSVERWVAPHDAVSAAIVTAVLIGDRTGLPDEIRLRLQAAGTYHVIAISGGNIAILAGLILAMLLVCGVTRPARRAGHAPPARRLCANRHGRSVGVARDAHGGSLSWRPDARSPQLSVARPCHRRDDHRLRAAARRARCRLHPHLRCHRRIVGRRTPRSVFLAARHVVLHCARDIAHDGAPPRGRMADRVDRRVNGHRDRADARSAHGLSRG